MLQFFTDIFLPPFNEEETRRMVTNLGAQMGLKYTDESLKRIYYESGGHPHLARQLCSLAADDSKPWPADIDSGKIESVVNEYISGSNPDLKDIWARLSPIEKKIITVLSEYDECSLNNVIESNMGTFERGEIINSLSDLERKHIVRKQDNRYTIAFPIFRKWIQFFKPKV